MSANKHLAAWLLAGWAAGLLPGAALACSCAPRDRAAAEAGAAVVFDGLAEQTAPADLRGAGRGWMVTTFQVSGPRKGLEPGQDRVGIVHRIDPGRCGVVFTPGQTVRVYAAPRTASGGLLSTDICAFPPQDLPPQP